MKLNNDTLIDLALIGGIITLSTLGMPGWGWLIFILFIRHE
jgi:hypothetical protein